MLGVHSNNILVLIDLFSDCRCWLSVKHKLSSRESDHIIMQHVRCSTLLDQHLSIAVYGLGILDRHRVGLGVLFDHISIAVYLSTGCLDGLNVLVALAVQINLVNLKEIQVKNWKK